MSWTRTIRTQTQIQEHKPRNLKKKKKEANSITWIWECQIIEIQLKNKKRNPDLEARSTTTTTTKYTNLIIISRFLTAEPIESPFLPLQGIDDFPTLSSSWSSIGSATSRPWVGVASFHAASTPLSLRSTTSSIGLTALSPMTTLRLLLLCFALWLLD